MRYVEPAVPSDDKRWRVVAATMRRHGNLPRGLIETLHTVQKVFGCLDDTSLRFVAAGLRVPLSKVYGVATFYHFFTLKPPGRHTCVVCLGTACYIKGGTQLLAEAQNQTHIEPGETTPDGAVSLLTARCLGACVLAPAVVCDGEVRGRMDASQMQDTIQGWLSHDD